MSDHRRCLCVNRSCSLRGFRVTTARSHCLGCDQKLHELSERDRIAENIGDLFGFDLDDLGSWFQ